MVRVPAVMLPKEVAVTLKLPAVAEAAPMVTAWLALGRIDTAPVPAFRVPARLRSPVVMEIGLLAEVERLCPEATVTVPVPLAERVTPEAPEEEELKVMPALLALVVRDKRPLAVMEPITLIA